jgi:predicted ester cyclase
MYFNAAYYGNMSTHPLTTNKELMITLDNAWNSQDWETFNARHADNVAVFWPGQADPTIGVHNHLQESIEFFKIFPDNHLINNPYKILIAEGDYTCSVADFTGTFKGPMKAPDGKMIQPTNKKFHLEFCTVARWKNKKILEERLFYDQVGMLKQIGAL